MPSPADVRYAVVTGGDGKPKSRFVLVVSKPIPGTQNVFLLTFSSKIHNARPDDVLITAPSELLQAGLTTPCYVSTNFILTLGASDITDLRGTLVKNKFELVMAKVKAHLG